MTNALNQHVTDYLQLRRALGFKLVFPGNVLPQFVAYLDAAGATTVTSKHAIAWARLPQNVQPITWAHRLGAVRGFATYLVTIDPANEVPPRDVFGARQQRRTPYIWSSSDIRALLHAASGLPSPQQAATCEALFGLLAVSGLRIGEAIGLSKDDVDLDAGVLMVRESKNCRSRLVPMHPSTTAMMKMYRQSCDEWFPSSRSQSFFLSNSGSILRDSGIRATFVKLTTSIGLRTETVHPRIHDLRHSFAVHTLIDWQRSGVDIGSQITKLSTYLGHVNPGGTYWYLSAVPELMELTATKLDVKFGGNR